MSAAPDRPIDIAVVGHTNAGKTSLLRTLTRRVNFGEVSDRPGTTRHVERIELRNGGQTLIRFFDTPGLEDAVSLRGLLDAFEPTATPPERIRRFLASPEAHGDFEQEAKVMRTLLEADAAFLVVDVREETLPKFRDEIELIGSCGRPVLPVLNFLASASARTEEWQTLLAAYGLHAVVRFDATAPFVGAEQALYQDLVTLLRDRRGQLDAIIARLAAESEQRRQASADRIAELLVEVASMRRTISADEHADRRRRQLAIAAMQQAVFEQAQRCADALIALYGFREDDAGEARLPLLEGRWSMDFFSPEAMKDAGIRLGKGTAVGAVFGAAADLAVGGLSLGAGAALGGAVGGALSQGWGPMGRKLANRLRNVHELSVEDNVLRMLLAWQLGLVRTLAERGHAATEKLPPHDLLTLALPAEALERVIRAVQPARQHPDWAETKTGRIAALWHKREPLQRQALVTNVSYVVQSITEYAAQRT